MNNTLFKREVKSNYKIAIIFLALITMYSTMIVAMFDPKLGESLKVMAESMPQLFSAFGMAEPASTLIEFIANYLYGFILVVIPMIFIIIISNRIVTRYVDRGSMAYLLATPNTRKKIITTQAIFLMVSILTLVIYATAIGLVSSQVMFAGDLDIKNYLLMNIGLYGLLFFFGGLCFFSSCYFNDSRFSLGVGGGLCVVFVLVQMLSQVGEKFENLKYLTPLTLFEASNLAVGKSEALVGVIVLYVVGIILYSAGIMVFNKKDISL